MTPTHTTAKTETTRPQQTDPSSPTPSEIAKAAAKKQPKTSRQMKKAFARMAEDMMEALSKQKGVAISAAKTREYFTEIHFLFKEAGHDVAKDHKLRARIRKAMKRVSLYAASAWMRKIAKEEMTPAERSHAVDMVVAHYRRIKIDSPRRIVRAWRLKERKPTP